MRPMAIIAAGVISPLGEGAAGYAVGELGARPETRVRPDAELAAAGLRRPNAARAPLAASTPGDRAHALLDRALSSLLTDLAATLPGFRELRLGVVLGTSSGGLGSLSELLAARARGQAISQEQALSASYFGPLRALERWSLSPVRLTQVLVACASSTVAMGIGCRWLEANACDLVIAGGYDALTTFAAAGFEALGATTASVPRPFRRDRDGLALGEGAALVALARPTETPALGYVLGFGLGSDAVHVTAPDRTGAGLARAARAALSDAEVEPSRIDLISAHATATPFNDSAEGHAMAAVIGATVERVVVHPFKPSPATPWALRAPSRPWRHCLPRARASCPPRTAQVSSKASFPRVYAAKTSPATRPTCSSCRPRSAGLTLRSCSVRKRRAARRARAHTSGCVCVASASRSSRRT